MIVFIGDSFTWGQGLPTEKWLTEGKCVEECNQFIPPKFSPDMYDYEDDKFRQDFHYPNLVSKYFNKSYATKWGNGGSNENIIGILKNMRNQFYADIGDSIDTFVIQLTCPGRSEYIPSDENIELEIREIDNIITSEMGPDYKNKWVGVSWRPEVGDILKNKFSENYVPLYYGDKEFTNFEELYDFTADNFTLKNKHIDIVDSHFSLEGHEFMAQSIISKLENSIFINV